MRYRFYFKDCEPVEVTAFDFKLRTPKSIVTWPYGSEGRGSTVDIAFGSAIARIADDHDRTVYEDTRESGGAHGLLEGYVTKGHN